MTSLTGTCDVISIVLCDLLPCVSTTTKARWSVALWRTAPGDVSGVCRQANWSGVLCSASERYLHEKANPLLIAEINWMPTSRHLLNAIGVLPIIFIWFIASMVVADGWSKIICNHHNDVVLNMYSYTHPANFESRSHWRTSASGLLKQFLLCKLQRKSSMLPRPPTAWVLSRCGHKTPWWSDT